MKNKIRAITLRRAQRQDVFTEGQTSGYIKDIYGIGFSAAQQAIVLQEEVNRLGEVIETKDAHIESLTDHIRRWEALIGPYETVRDFKEKRKSLLPKIRRAAVHAQKTLDLLEGMEEASS